MRMAVLCNRGFERYAAREVLVLGGRASEVGDGSVFFEGEERTMYSANRYGRTFDRVLVQLSEVRLNEKDLPRGLIEGADWKMLKELSGLTLTADSFLRRVHPRLLTEVSALASKAVEEKRSASRKEIHLFLLARGASASLWLDTSGESLNRREYRVYNHPSSVKPTLAASLVLMGECRGGVLYDPFAGGGTILIEAGLMGLGRPTHLKRSYSYRQLETYDPKVELDSVPPRSVCPPFEGLIGSEINEVHLRGCLKNLRSAGLPEVRVKLEDCTRVVLDHKVDLVVTNPPYGVRGAKLGRMAKLYERWMLGLPKVLKANGVCVVVTTEHRLLRALVRSRGYRMMDSARTLHGDLWVEAVKFRAS